MKMIRYMLTIMMLLTVSLSWAAVAPDAGKALQFDSDLDDKATIPYNSGLHDQLTSGFTMEMWVNIADLSVEPRLLQRKDVFALYVDASGTVQFNSKNGAGITLSSTSTLNQNTWYHIAVTVEDAGGGSYTAKLFINGSQDASGTDPLYELPVVNQATNVGNNLNMTFGLDGLVDDLRFWTTVKTAAEINTYKNVPLSGMEPDLLGYYDMNGTGTVLTDKTGNLNAALGAAPNDPARVVSTAPIAPQDLLIHPNGETFQIGDDLHVYWQFANPVTDVNILYSWDNGANWQYLVSEIANSNHYQTYVPGVPTTQALIKVEDASDDTYFVQSTPNTVTEPLNWKREYTMEAEDGVISRPMILGKDGRAFDCTFVYSYDNRAGTVDLSFNVDKAGVYVVWAHGFGAGSTRNSFFISVDGGPEYIWDMIKGAKWAWDTVSGRGDEGIANVRAEMDPLLLKLDAGNHTITFRGREHYSRLDRIVVTNDLNAHYWGQKPHRMVSIQSPLENDAVPRMKPHEIRWDSRNVGGDMTIILELIPSQQRITLASNTDNDGSFIWNVGDYEDDEGNLYLLPNGTETCPYDKSWRPFDFIDPDPEFTVTQPNGGEEWMAGMTKQVTWTSSYFGGTVGVDFSADSGATWTTIATGQAANGSFDWLVPNTPSKKCLVKVYDDSQPQFNDSSDEVFEILPESTQGETLTVTAPNGGEIWTAGQVHQIIWDSDGFSGLVSIDVSIDNGSTWSTIATNQPDSGAFNWSPPNLTADSAWVRVYDETDQDPLDMSDGPFAIVPQSTSGESLTLIAPNGGEELATGSQYMVNWDSEDYDGLVNVDVSLDNGQTWLSIATDQPDSGAVEWTVPDVATDSAWVKVYDPEDQDPSDMSDEPFAIVIEPPQEINYALSFDGIDDLVRVLPDTTLNVADNFTIEFWIKTDNPHQSWSRVLEKGSWDEYYIGFYGSRARLHGALRTSIGGGYTRMTVPVGPSSTELEANEWYHFAATYDHDTRTAKLYMNGTVEVVKAATVEPRTLYGELIIGAVRRLTRYEYHLDAILDDLRIWNRARTSEQINESMYNGITGEEDGLVAYYPFDEGSGQIAHDLTVNINHGFLGLAENADESDPTWIECDRPMAPPAVGGETQNLALDVVEATPEDYVLYNNYPNPFNAGTTIRFNIPTQKDANVTLQVFDIQGRLIRTLAKGNIGSGLHTFQWDGTGQNGRIAPSGIYFYRLTAGDFQETKRMVMIK